MKTLLILRHAESSRSDPTADDHDRPLNAQGLRDAPSVGRLLAHEGLVPELVLSSTARRARETARLVVEATNREVKVRLVPELYLADPGTCMRTVEATDDGLQRVMVVGHNPGVEDLLASLTGARQRMSTAALAAVRVPCESWGLIDCTPGCELVRVWQPEKLKYR